VPQATNAYGGRGGAPDGAARRRVASRLEAAYGPNPSPWDRVTPQGRPRRRRCRRLRRREAHDPFSSRFEGFDEPIVKATCSDSISIGPLRASNGGHGAMVMLDAVDAPVPGDCGGLGELESSRQSSHGRARVTALHAARRVPRAGAFPRRVISAITPRSTHGGGARAMERSDSDGLPEMPREASRARRVSDRRLRS